MICPYCNGRKTVESLLHFANRGCEWRTLPCDCCRGAGEITGEHAERIVTGRKMRDERLARGASQREEAKRLGITPQELSRREHGRAV